MVLIGCLGEDTDVQRYLRHPPAANMGRCPRQQRDAARQTVNRPERCQAAESAEPKESPANGAHLRAAHQRYRSVSIGHHTEGSLGSAKASIPKPGSFDAVFSGHGEQAAGISGSELATMNRGGVAEHRSRLATFVLFAARTGDDQSPRDNEDNASSEENAPEKSESEETKNNDEHKLELQGFGHEREGEQGSDAAESHKRPEARARGTSQDLQKSVEHIIRAERERYSKEEDEDGDKDEVQNSLLPSEESGVEAEGLDAVEQQRERRQQTLRVQEVLGRQEDGALVAEFKGRGGGSGMGGVDKVAKGEWTERTLGEEELAGWRTQPATMPAQQLGEPSEEDEAQPTGEFDGMVAVRVQYQPEEEDVLNVFLKFFRKMFGGMFEVDRENSVVSMTGQGKGNMPLKTARCLEHALRVCRENDFQPRDFLLVRARQALPGEDARGPNKHLILGGNVPAGATLGHLSNNYGIVVDKVEPEVLNFPALHATDCVGTRGGRSGPWEEKEAPGGGEGGHLLPPPKYSIPSWSGPGERVKVVQLWGLTHCVNPAYERLVAVKSNQWKQCLRLGACDVLSLGKSIRMRQNSATVKLNEVLGVLSVEGNPIDVDGLFSRMVGFLSSNLPNSLATVDMVNAGVMRHLATPCALPAIAEEAKVHINLISLVPWWQKTHMLVLVPGGGSDPEVLRRVCGALHRLVKHWCDRNVSILLWPALIANAEQASDRKRDGNSKDLRHAFATSISEAAGTDLWLDGFHLRGMIADPADHEAAQARLEEQKAKLLARLGMKDESRKRTTGGKVTNTPPKPAAVFPAPSPAISPRSRLGRLEAPLPAVDTSDECDPRRHQQRVYHHRHDHPGSSRQYYQPYQRPSMATGGAVPFFRGGPNFPSFSSELSFGDAEDASRPLGRETRLGRGTQVAGGRVGEYMVPSLTAEPGGTQTVLSVNAAEPQQQHHVHHHHVHHYHHYQQPTHASETRERVLHGSAPKYTAQELQQFSAVVPPDGGAATAPLTYRPTHQQEQTPQAMLAQHYSSSPYYTVHAHAGGGGGRAEGHADGCQAFDGSLTGESVYSTSGGRAHADSFSQFLGGNGMFVQKHYKDCGGGGGGGGGGGWLQG